MDRGQRGGAPIVSVVIPTYNEADNIEELIGALSRSLSSHGFNDYELIVVDDDSPDGTWRIVERISADDNRVRVIRRVNRRGLASAVLEGARASNGRYIVVMDADFQHPPELVPVLLDRALKTGADVVVASRYTKGGGVEGWSRIRFLISKGATVLAHLLVKESRLTTDPMSGFFLARRDLLTSDSLRPRGYKVLLEVLGRLGGTGIRVVDVPYVFRRRKSGASKLGISTIIDYLLHVISLSKLAKFAAVGASGMAVNLFIMWALMELGVDYNIASLAGIEASILSNFVINDLWTFEASNEGRLKRLLGYHAGSAGSIIITFSTMKILYVVFSVYQLIGQAIGIILGFIFNYLASSRYIWGGRLGASEK